jgi:hypothetical protein
VCLSEQEFVGVSAAIDQVADDIWTVGQPATRLIRSVFFKPLMRRAPCSGMLCYLLNAYNHAANRARAALATFHYMDDALLSWTYF